MRLTRADLADAGQLQQALAGVDAVIHLAGVNRAESEAEVEVGNVEIAEALGAAIETTDRPLHVVYGNSVHADADSAYGRGKAAAGQRLAEAVRRTGGTIADVRLPNLFGEHGRAHYNSFVATFCDEVANGREPQVTGDRPVSLLHAQRAAESLLAAAEAGGTPSCVPRAPTGRCPTCGT